MTDPQLRDHLRAEVHALGAPADVADDVDLFATAALTSMQLLELINRLEDAFGVVVEERDVAAGRLRSIASLTDLVRARRGVA